MNILMHPQTRNEVNRFTGSVGHALSLTGESGSGKGHLAKYIVSEILKIESEKILVHPYVRLIDVGKSGSGIDEVRSIQTFLKLRVPGSDTIRRAVIIEHIDRFGHEAQNALLKTLEEPPEDTTIIVTFSQSDLVLPTIHSRVRNIKVRPVAAKDAMEYFNDTANDNEINRAIYMSSGQPGLLSALLGGEDEHPLVSAIDTAKRLIVQSRYERLSQVDKLAKSKEVAPELLVDGIYRLLHAGYQQAVGTKSAAELKPIVARLRLVDNASSDLQNKVQPKLVLSRLFSEL